MQHRRLWSGCFLGNMRSGRLHNTQVVSTLTAEPLVPVGALALCVLLVLSACGGDNPSRISEETPVLTHSLIKFKDHVGAAVSSLNERIYTADVIVRATLISTGDNLLTFNALEYLKGTGGAQLTITSEADHNTEYDDREAVLFLSTPEDSGSASGRAASPATYAFTDTTSWPSNYRNDSIDTYYQGSLPTGYTV